MGLSQVDYVSPKELLPITVKTTSFASEQFAVNNNPSISFNLYAMLSSEFTGSAKAQGSLDGTTWVDLRETTAILSGDDEVLWTLSELQSLMFVRLYVTISSGSAAIQILARGT